MTETTTPEERGLKRPRVVVACDVCRAKKSKCDGIRPVCGPCTRRRASSNQCTWDNGDARSLQLSRTEITQLQRRVRELESGIPPQPPSSSPIHSTPIMPHSGQHQVGWISKGPDRNIPIEDMEDQPSPTRGYPYATDPELTTTDVHDQTPAVSASGMIGSVPDQARSEEYFGKSSAGCFIDQIRRVIGPKLSPEKAIPRPRSSATISQGYSTGSSHGNRAQLDFVLPSRNQADQLLQIYWDIVYPLYPYVDCHEIMQKYNGLWLGEVGYKEDAMFVCILNVIFALCTQLNGAIDPRQRQSSAQIFFGRAKDLLEIWTVSTLELVQAHLLLGQYFQSTNDPFQCWTVVGLAVRTAQSLGLHLPEMPPSSAISPRQRELCRKVWHGCVLMDRVTSMTYGRPSMVGRRLAVAVPKPLSVDEDRLPTNIDGPMPLVDRPSVVDFFVQTLGLYEILHEVLAAFYSTPNSEDLSTEGKLGLYFGRKDSSHSYSPSILDIDRDLMKWHSELPTHLKIDVASVDVERPKPFLRQAIVLHQRFLHIRLLNLRPVLAAYVAADTSTVDDTTASKFGGRLSERIALQCAIVCVTVAQETIDLAYTRRSVNPTDVGPVAAWWYNVFFVYSAATVLVAAKICPAIEAEISSTSITRSWTRAMDVLKHYRVLNPVIERLIAALKLLFSVLPEHYAHAQTHPRGDKHFLVNNASETRGAPPASGHTANTTPVTNAQGAIPPHHIGDGLSDGNSGHYFSHTAPSDPFHNNNGNPQTDPSGIWSMSSEQGSMSLDIGSGFVFDSNDLSWLNSTPFDL